MIGGHLSARRPPAMTITTWHGPAEFASSWTHTCRRKHFTLRHKLTLATSARSQSNKALESTHKKLNIPVTQGTSWSQRGVMPNYILMNQLCYKLLKIAVGAAWKHTKMVKNLHLHIVTIRQYVHTQYISIRRDLLRLHERGSNPGTDRYVSFPFPLPIQLPFNRYSRSGLANFNHRRATQFVTTRPRAALLNTCIEKRVGGFN